MKKQMGWALIAGTLGIFLMSAVPVRAADAPATPPSGPATGGAAAADKTMAPSATDKPVVKERKHKAAKKTGVKSKREHKTKKI